MAGEIYELSRPTFICTIKDEDESVMDISGATALSITFRKPDKTTLDVTAVLSGDGTDGKIKYNTPVTLFADGTAGQWSMQGFVTLSGKRHPSSIHNFVVYESILD